MIKTTFNETIVVNEIITQFGRFIFAFGSP